MKIKPIPASALKPQSLVIVQHKGIDLLLLVEKLTRENGMTQAVCRSSEGSVLLRVPDSELLDSVV